MWARALSSSLGDEADARPLCACLTRRFPCPFFPRRYARKAAAQATAKAQGLPDPVKEEEAAEKRKKASAKRARRRKKHPAGYEETAEQKRKRKRKEAAAAEL